MVEINNLKSQRKQRNQNKVLMRRVHVEQRKATKYRKQCLRQMKKIVKPATVTKSPKNKKSEKAQKVESFLLLEENSILLPGKKDVVGRKVKKQRRVLTKPLTDLHKAYMQTCDRKQRMSYRQFTRYRPFYITEAKPKDRNTCACYQHENMSLLIDSLASRGLLPTKSLSELLASITCSTADVRCMQRLCTNCCYDEVQFNEYSESDSATWEQWEKVDAEVGGKMDENNKKGDPHGVDRTDPEGARRNCSPPV